jgi:hypothetical protein
MPEHTPITVVIIDDDPLHRKLVESHLSKSDPVLRVDRVRTYADPYDALSELDADGLTVILCDHDMPHGTGESWLRELIRPDVGPVILHTGSGSERLAVAAFREGVSDYLLKADTSDDPAALRQAIADAIRRFKLQRRNRDAWMRDKRTIRDIEQQNHTLKQMTETAHQFVDDVAHEFRTPLTVIREFASILRDEVRGPVNTEQDQFLAHIMRAAEDLNKMVEDFLDTSRLKHRVLRVDRRPTRIEDVFERVGSLVAPHAQTKSIRVAFHDPPGLTTVLCDAEKAGRAIVNLVINAIKFSEPDGVVRVAADASDAGVRVTVSDDGVGMTPEDLETVGTRFRTLGDPRQTSAHGFGLGLSIVRSLVWLNLGTMSIHSEHGRGTTIGFTLPATDPARVLSSHVARIAESEPNTDLTVLRLSPASGETCEALRERLVAVSRTMDLLLETPGGQIVAVGPCRQPRRWAERLHATLPGVADERANRGGQSIEVVGCWPVATFSDSATPIVLNYLSEQKRCA